MYPRDRIQHIYFQSNGIHLTLLDTDCVPISQLHSVNIMTDNVQAIHNNQATVMLHLYKILDYHNNMNTPRKSEYKSNIY